MRSGTSVAFVKGIFSNAKQTKVVSFDVDIRIRLVGGDTSDFLAFRVIIPEIKRHVAFAIVGLVASIVTWLEADFLSVGFKFLKQHSNSNVLPHSLGVPKQLIYQLVLTLF